MKKIIPIGVLFLILLWWKPLNASACSCVMAPPPEDALDNADAVFIGEVVKITKRNGNSVHFKVEKVWKGIDDSKVVVATGFGEGGGDCGFNFVEGQKYLVYATVGDMYVKNTLSTTICHRTTEISGATEDLNALGEGKEVSQPETSESFGEQENMDEDHKVAIPWLGFAIFILGLLIILIGFRYKKS